MILKQFLMLFTNDIEFHICTQVASYQMVDKLQIQLLLIFFSPNLNQCFNKIMLYFANDLPILRIKNHVVLPSTSHHEVNQKKAKNHNFTKNVLNVITTHFYGIFFFFYLRHSPEEKFQFMCSNKDNDSNMKTCMHKKI